MISKVQSVLFAFWQQFGLPVYLQGNVDEDAELPYFVINIESADVFESSLLYATLYVTGEQFGTRRDTLDAVAKAIPYQGTRLDGVVLYRNTGGWLTYGKEDETIDVHYGRVGYEVRNYNI